MFTSASGSNDPAWWANSTSADFESKLPVFGVPPLPVSVSELTVSSNLTISSLVASPVLMVTLVGPAEVPVWLPPQRRAHHSSATIATVKYVYRFIVASKSVLETGGSRQKV